MYESIYSKKLPEKKRGLKNMSVKIEGGPLAVWSCFFLGGGKIIGFSLCTRMSMEVSNDR